LTCRLQFDRVRASILGQISIVTGGEFGDGLVGRTQADDPLADVEAINHHEPAFTFWCAATSTGESGLVAHREQLAQGLKILDLDSKLRDAEDGTTQPSTDLLVKRVWGAAQVDDRIPALLRPRTVGSIVGM
jgi:hypothetical protein